MRELLGIGPRRTHMKLLGLVLVLPLVLAGCGDDGPVADDGPGQVPSPSCASPGSPVDVGRADLDGDGTAERLAYVPATAECAASLTTVVGGRKGSVPLDDDLPVAAGQSFAISIAGREGEIAVLRQQHPRGGFQVILLGWTADRGLSTLEVHNDPVFPFVATDTESTPLSADCTDDGFEITRARAHEPIGVAPAWDVDRTTYTVDGNTVTRGATTEVADNVLEKDFRATYRALTSYSLFENCRADR